MKLNGTYKYFIFFFCVIRNVYADQPLWEAGAGVTWLDFAAYRGSDQNLVYVLPIPYFVYRGDFLKVERERVRSLLFKDEKAEIDLSIGGTVPVNSDKVSARSGMPDLDATLELGPSLNITLYESDSGNNKWELRLPLRAAFAVSFSQFRNIGWLFQPQINLDKRNIPGMEGWDLGMLAGPIFSGTRYNQYFYSVDPQYATSTRPAYEASGGYDGLQFIAALSKRFPNYWVGGFIKYDTLKGSVLTDSPLVKTKSNFSGGIAISWIFDKSQTMVKDTDK